MYLGVDVGGTSTRIALFQDLSTAQFTQIARFPTLQDYAQQMQAIISAVEQSGLRDLGGIGVSIGGRMAKDGRSVLVAPNLPEYVGEPFADDLAGQFGCPVWLAHDTVCGLLGEKQFGSLQSVERCAYLTISTGTGAAIQLRKGPLALTVSIEVGHQLLDGNSLVCLCGQIGCLETFTGGKQLQIRLGHSIAQVQNRAFWETFSEKLALGLVNLAHLTRVEAIAVSGGILLNTPFLLELLQQKVDVMIRGATLQLAMATLGENAPLVGAALLSKVPDGTILH